MRIGIGLLVIVGSIVISSCGNIKKPNSGSDNGNLVKLKSMAVSYYQDSTLSGIANEPSGGVCKFYPDGMIKSIFTHKEGKEVNDLVELDDSGRVKAIMGYDFGSANTGIFFQKHDIVEAFPHLAVVAHSNTFVTLDPEKDTITLGETYSAKIIVNFPTKGYACEIYKAHKKIDTAHIIAKGTEAIFTETPTDLGEHEYAISVLLHKEKDPNKKTNRRMPIDFVARYYVKAK